jgi:hypothetical protein
MVPGLWHEVIVNKYLRKKSVAAWLRQGSRKWSGGSNIWRALTLSLNIINEWLVWKPGDGRDVRIGSDPMVGSHNFYQLSRNLISKLKDLGFEFLAQVGTVDLENSRQTGWIKAEVLGLEGDLKDEWNNYVKGLVSLGIELNKDKDLLMWSWDTKSGQVSAKKAYEVQMLEVVETEPVFWYNDLWKWQLPLKVKLFMWLLLEQRILTWENLVKRGYHGPSRCILCGNCEETAYHLFVVVPLLKIFGI